MKKYIPAYAVAFLLSLVGLAVGMLWQSTTATVALAVASALPLLLLLGNLLLARCYVARIRSTRVADMQSYMLGHRAEAERTAVVLLRKLRRMRRALTCYTALLVCLAAAAAFFGGYATTLTDTFSLYIGTLYAGTILFTVFARLPKKERTELDDTATVLSPEEYPAICSVVSRAAEALGCRGEVKVLLSFDCNASIFAEEGRYYLQLGAILVGLLSEQELYAICLHEFSHCSAKNRAIEREGRFASRISSGRELSPVMRFAYNLFSFGDVRYLFCHMTYSYATAVVKESEADRDMARYGSAEAAASALVKINYEDKFRWESGVLDEPSPYASETPSQSYVSDQLSRLRSAIDARQSDWNGMLSREILANNATHPTLRMRLEVLGVGEIRTTPDGGDAAYSAERERLIAFADRRIAELQDSYAEDRREAYLEPLARITAWKESGMPLSAETYADVVSDLKRIGLHGEAEALCDRAIRELDENSSQHAYFIKGAALLYRYDEQGMELLYHAIEKNHNYMEEGLLVIGEFCCMTGREKELAAYRELAREYAQRDVDEYSETGVLTRRDNLSRDDMPREMLDEILTFIRSAGGDLIGRVYLVRKTISESFFTSAFVLCFYGGTDSDREQVYHKIFRYLDSYPVEWQFSLFDYSDCLGVKLDKIEGSLVYSRDRA